MKRLLLLYMPFFIAVQLYAQPLNTRNYSHIYNPSAEVILNQLLVRSGNTLTVMFSATFHNELFTTKDWKIEFETRESLGDKSGNPVTQPIDTLISSERSFSGRVSFLVSGEPLLVAVVTKIPGNEKFYFWKYIPQHTTPYIIADGVLIADYISVESQSKVGGFISDQLIASLYTQDFPAAAPPFSVRQSRVNSLIRADSIFEMHNLQQYQFSIKGLYLVQEDTTSSLGLAFRCEQDYPKLGTIQSLIGPLIYICTSQEYQKLLKSEGEKKKFDQVILSITGDTERAKTFMRYFFYRVELANTYFTSYKEGWKTDRGMIFIVYGLPSAVYLFGNREVWEYGSGNERETFTFERSPTVFDQDNFVLIRDKRYEDLWYRSIDLLRKSRF